MIVVFPHHTHLFKTKIILVIYFILGPKLKRLLLSYLEVKFISTLYDVNTHSTSYVASFFRYVVTVLCSNTIQFCYFHHFALPDINIATLLLLMTHCLLLLPWFVEYSLSRFIAMVSSLIAGRWARPQTQ